MIPKGDITILRAAETTKAKLFRDRIAELRLTPEEIQALAYERASVARLRRLKPKGPQVVPPRRRSPSTEQEKLIARLDQKTKELKSLKLKAAEHLQDLLYEETLEARLLDDFGNIHSIPRNVWISTSAPEIFQSGRATYALEGQVYSGQVILDESELRQKLFLTSTIGTPAPPTFRRDGKEWEFSWEGDSIRWANLNGFGYIHRLLSVPFEEVSSVDLVGGAIWDSLPSGDPDVLLDKKAAWEVECALEAGREMLASSNNSAEDIDLKRTIGKLSA